MPKFTFDAQRYPTDPGCYLMKDSKSKVIYVGKAKNLRRRLATYFQKRRKRWNIRQLVPRIRDIEVILVTNETESLVLENNLIKHYKPRYNRALKRESSGYYYIVVTDEEFPRFVPFRKHRVNKQLHDLDCQGYRRRFGPYLSVRFRDVLLEYVADKFQIRTCQPMPAKVCLRYHMHHCNGICEQRVTSAENAPAVERAIAFLSHDQTEIVQEMKNQMQAYAESLEFERAKWIRDRVEVLERTLQKQVVERDIDYDEDVIYFSDDAKVVVANVKHGALWHLAFFDLPPKQSKDEAYREFILDQYAEDCPRELVVNRLKAPADIAMSLTTESGSPVRITVPESGDKLDLLKICEVNYKYRTSELIERPSS